MDRLPPKLIRRLILAPLVFLICLGLIAVSPVFLLGAALADVFLPGSWRTTRMVAFGVVYLVFEVVGLIVMLVLWIASGFGAGLRSPLFVDLHYAVMAKWLKSMYMAVALLFGLRINIEERPAPQPGPLLVFCRHAGPGNSLMLIGTMMIAYRRRPRIVMLAKLQWDPLFDTMGNRLPNRFITHDKNASDRYVNAIGELARGLGDQDAFVLFPEGKDFTQRLRERAIERLRRGGFLKHADQAEQMHNVLPPRHRGPLAAITNAPEADVAFVAHSVLEDIGTFRELWRHIPLEEPIDAQYWRIPPDEVPESEEEVIDWLYAWWENIDEWIEAHKPAPV
ncbi:MAG TPA: 1-acyl-sn-glycerol-3-phosphate acyltransferase [Actinomycetota bacterium]|nr:1-acyl-sn-glycerol-3-phosphate acyltransferase [Actinomycetota bacterium]